MAEKNLNRNVETEREEKQNLKESKKKTSKVKSVKIKGYTTFKVHAGKGIP